MSVRRFLITGEEAEFRGAIRNTNKLTTLRVPLAEVEAAAGRVVAFPSRVTVREQRQSLFGNIRTLITDRVHLDTDVAREQIWIDVFRLSGSDHRYGLWRRGRIVLKAFV